VEKDAYRISQSKVVAALKRELAELGIDPSKVADGSTTTLACKGCGERWWPKRFPTTGFWRCPIGCDAGILLWQDGDAVHLYSPLPKHGRANGTREEETPPAPSVCEPRSPLPEPSRLRLSLNEKRRVNRWLAWLRREYDALNAELWEGKLPEVVILQENRRLFSADGKWSVVQAWFKQAPGTAPPRLDPKFLPRWAHKIYFNTFLLMFKRNLVFKGDWRTKKKRLRKILIHEMAHVAVHTLRHGVDDGDHGPLFMAEMVRVTRSDSTGSGLTREAAAPAADPAIDYAASRARR